MDNGNSVIFSSGSSIPAQQAAYYAAPESSSGNSKRTRNIIIIVVIILLLVGGGVAAYFLLIRPNMSSSLSCTQDGPNFFGTLVSSTVDFHFQDKENKLTADYIQTTRIDPTYTGSKRSLEDILSAAELNISLGDFTKSSARIQGEMVVVEAKDLEQAEILEYTGFSVPAEGTTNKEDLKASLETSTYVTCVEEAQSNE